MGKKLYTDPKTTAILVLGAAVWANGPSPTLSRRCQRAADIWDSGAASHVIVSGGVGKFAPSEAEAMKALLEAKGVPANTITLEDQATSTLENLQFSLPILGRLGATRVILVTDLTHAPRALLTARWMGLSSTVKTPSLRGARKRTLFYQAIRELFALPAYAWRLWLSYKR